METLEELKAIIADKPEGATHIDDIKTYWKVISEFDYYFYNRSQWNDSEPLENSFTRSLSDIERIIELMEQVSKIEPAKEECKHPSSTASYTHVTCDSCHMIRTDGGWGCASRKWFDNVESAKFYEKNGFLPK
jgi:hypothetical protein